MDWKIELVAIPVTDVDRAKAFYVDQVGFNADHDHTVSDSLRFVQLTPPGSACSIVMGTGVTEMEPGSQKGVQVVVADVAAARQQFAPPWGRGQRGRRTAVGPVRHIRRSRWQHLGVATDPGSRVIRLEPAQS
jgi:catechol 2,3-dioxygenase-like lactoylglutathione lyase family enzyme